MDILRKITGHRTAEIVLKHYDRRGREAMRRAIGDAMPKAIAGAVEDRRMLAAAAGARQGDKEAELVQSLPPGLAALLEKATPEQLENVAKLLKKGGEK